MSFYRRIIESLSGYSEIKNTNISDFSERMYRVSNTDHKSLGQVVTLPEGSANCPTDYLTSQELHQKSNEAREFISKLAHQ